MFKHIFGPVPSRRLGISLGIDLVPKKLCSFDCIYCECGKTTKQTINREEFVKIDDVIAELKTYFSMYPDPAYITFSGSGEPTLNSNIGEVIDFLNFYKPDIPVAVLTNGSLLYLNEVRTALLKADLVLPSLDAASIWSFEKINRPHPGLNLNKQINGLMKFKREFKGEIWLEVFIVPGINDSEKELQALKSTIKRINPEKVQLNTLDRPGAEEALSAASTKDLQMIAKFLDHPCIEIIAANVMRDHIECYSIDLEHTILSTISRRPCTIEDLSEIVAVDIRELRKYLGELMMEHRLKTKVEERGVFYLTA